MILLRSIVLLYDLVWWLLLVIEMLFFCDNIDVNLFFIIILWTKDEITFPKKQQIKKKREGKKVAGSSTFLVLRGSKRNFKTSKLGFFKVYQKSYVLIFEKNLTSSFFQKLRLQNHSITYV